MKNKDWIVDIESYKESLIGGFNDIEEVDEIINEIKEAKVGTLKPNCWQKISEDEIIVFES